MCDNAKKCFSEHGDLIFKDLLHHLEKLRRKSLREKDTDRWANDGGLNEADMFPVFMCPWMYLLPILVLLCSHPLFKHCLYLK